MKPVLYLISLFLLFWLMSCQNGDHYLSLAQPVLTTEQRQCWEQHNLAVLTGCWQLGEDRLQTCYDGNTPFPCSLSAWSVCFDDKGNSTSSLVSLTMKGIEYDCHPDYAAHFNGSNQLVIENDAVVICNEGFQYNSLDRFTCDYQNDGKTSCVYVKTAADDPDNGSTTLLQRIIDPNEKTPSSRVCQ